MTQRIQLFEILKPLAPPNAARYYYSMSKSAKVLIITPWVPWPVTGADQQDRFYGFQQLQAAGYKIHVVAKIHVFQNRHDIEMAFYVAGIPLTLVSYVPSLLSLCLRRIGRIIRAPALLDGAALEYIDPVMEKSVIDIIRTFKPDVGWVDFSFLWPMVRLLKAHGIPTVLRSANNEAQQALDEHGHNLRSRIVSIPKFASERIAARESDIVLAITPWEKEWYRQCGAKNVEVLPLRGLGRCLRRHQHREKSQLDVVFLSSSYTNGHNRDALQFLLMHIIPAVQEQAPGAFRFHITGKKFPEEWKQYFSDIVRSVGFVPDISALLDTMDIALCPSVSGQGMQQKIFEPLCCGLPLITHHTAGYPFDAGTEVLIAQTAQEYTDHLLALRDITLRQSLSDRAYEKSMTLFSDDRLVTLAKNAIHSVL